MTFDEYFKQSRILDDDLEDSSRDCLLRQKASIKLLHDQFKSEINTDWPRWEITMEQYRSFRKVSGFYYHTVLSIHDDTGMKIFITGQPEDLIWVYFSNAEDMLHFQLAYL